MKYILAIITISYAIACLSKVVTNGLEESRALIKHAHKIEFGYGTPGDVVRRIVEGIWFVLYCIITYRLLQ